MKLHLKLEPHEPRDHKRGEEKKIEKKSKQMKERNVLVEDEG
jgi:hypothetical protein